MNKKLIYFAALAAMATFASCSNDDDLTNVAVTPEEGDLVAISVSSDGTRGVNVENKANSSTNTAAFASFQMYGYKTSELATKNTPWINNTLFTPADGIWSDGASKWSTEKTETYNFYAYSINGATEATDEFDIASNAFTNSQNPPTYSNTYSFDYKTPSDVVNQHDLLVSTKQGITRPAGNLAMTFHHILSSLNFQITVNKSYIESFGDWEPDEGHEKCEGFKFILHSITVHNIKPQRTFIYGTDDADLTSVGRWDGDDASGGNISCKVTFGDGDLSTENSGWEIPIDDQFHSSVPNEGSIFVIPQEAIASTEVAEGEPTPNTSTSGMYLEIECQLYQEQGDLTADNVSDKYLAVWLIAEKLDADNYLLGDEEAVERGKDITQKDTDPEFYNTCSGRYYAGWGKVYVPLKISGGELLAGKNHNVRINLCSTFMDDGSGHLDRSILFDSSAPDVR